MLVETKEPQLNMVGSIPRIDPRKGTTKGCNRVELDWPENDVDQVLGVLAKRGYSRVHNRRARVGEYNLWRQGGMVRFEWVEEDPWEDYEDSMLLIAYENFYGPNIERVVASRLGRSSAAVVRRANELGAARGKPQRLRCSACCTDSKRAMRSPRLLRGEDGIRLLCKYCSGSGLQRAA